MITCSTVRVLMLSLDPNILDPERVAGRRMADYATLVDTLAIVLFSSGGKKQEHGNLVIYPTSRNKPVSFLKGFWIAYRVLRKERYDLITLQEPFPLSLIAFSLAWLFRLPLEVQVHSTFFSPYWRESLKNTSYQFLARLFVPRATCIRAVSERIKRDLVRGLSVPESKITVLPIFVDARRFADSKPSFDLHARYPQFDFIAVAASRLVRQKNVELAIEACKKFVAKHPRAGLVIVGAEPYGKKEYEKELRERCRGFENSVVFAGWSDDIISYYKGADVFLLTSNYEGWAMSVIEAMASGTAVVMTDVGCAGEVVRSGKNGIVVPVGDVQALYRALAHLHEHPKEKERLAAFGQHTALSLEPESWEVYLAQYKNNWEQCSAAYVRNKSF